MRYSLSFILALSLAGLQFLAITTVVSTTYVSSQRAMLEHARGLMDDAGANAAEHTKRFLEPAGEITEQARLILSSGLIDVDDAELVEDAINGMLQSLDPHSSYVGPDGFKDLQVNTSGEYGGLGMEVTSESGVVKVISPIDDTPAFKAGIKSGDYLTEIDGESIIGLTLNEAVDRMRGKPGEPITITVIRDDEDPKEFTLIREIIKRPVVKFEVKEDVGYSRISQFNEKTSEELEEAISALRTDFGGKIPGIVLDLRGNPGGLLDQSIKVSSAFLDGGEVVSTRGRVASDTERYESLEQLWAKILKWQSWNKRQLKKIKSD